MKNELNRAVNEYRRSLTIPSADQIRVNSPEIYRQAMIHHEQICDLMESREFNFRGVFLQSQLLVENELHSLLKKLKRAKRDMKFADMIKRLKEYEGTDDIARVLTDFRNVRNKLVHEITYLPTAEELKAIVEFVIRYKQACNDESQEDPYSIVT